MFMLYKDSVIIENLKEAYTHKLHEFHDSMYSGNGLDGKIWDSLILLGSIMGKTADDILDDMREEVRRNEEAV